MALAEVRAFVFAVALTLMLEGEGLCDHRFQAAGLRDSDQRREQMGEQNKQIFHRQLHYQSGVNSQDFQRTRRCATMAIRLLQGFA